MLRRLATFTLTAVGLGVLLLPARARAEGGFSVGVEGGVMEFNPRASFQDAGVAWGLRASFGFFGPTRLEARFLSAGHVLEDGESINLRQGTAQIRVSILPHSESTPYLFGGVGMRLTDRSLPGSHASDSYLIVPLGAGFDFALGDHIFLAPEFTWHHRVGETDPDLPPMVDDDVWNVSLVFKLSV